MLDYIVEQTEKFITSRPKEVRKTFGQFFTSKLTARFMAGLFEFPYKNVVKILDPGAGSGILSAAVIEAIETHCSTVIKKIELTCYETNRDIIPLLEANIEFMKYSSKLNIKATIIKDNYLLSQSDDIFRISTASATQQTYDMVIGNPPYFKLPKNAPEAVSMPMVCHGAPNMYSLFAAMSLFNLNDGGEMVYIIPRSWTSGAYFSRFRNYLLHHGKLTDIHLFASRKKVFDKEDVLQETMIMKLRKTYKSPPKVRITSSVDAKNFDNTTALSVPYSMVVSGKERFVYLVTSQEEANALRLVNAFECPMPQIGLKMKTGLTVDFRNKELLRNNYGDHTVPLFYSQHIKNGRVVFPIGKENEYLSDELPSMLQLNRNYLFVKRITAKEEQRRLQCAVYLANYYPEYKNISTQNKINFIDTIDNSVMSEELVCGLYIVLNSTLYDMYYRILNGSTQVNSTEINTIPMPTRNCLERLGRKLMKSGDYSTEHCDKILDGVIYA
ncbi:MAG: Eco57I restriction-modification methylase domain-containing protein [Chitinispirillales bacterium]|jgi:adenine-specific DNA-methyltransferase|nr:Eco57I restriction-modification methylase domain-containing protein [Chitinispirillales bacterium]